MLFPGGTAQLQLTDPDDPETTGVEVIAQPRGKKLAKMTLMSGGEKSLTALALLFAVYRTRPCPFYILDEVEAALDDTNLRRFVAFVDSMRRHTQFIVVTHQRRTMEMADVLYGVSMQADGVSQGRQPEARARARARGGQPMSTPWFRRLADGLTKSRERLGEQLNVLLRRGPDLDEEFWTDLEDALLGADIGFTATTEIVDELRDQAARKALPDAAAVLEHLVERIAAEFPAGEDVVRARRPSPSSWSASTAPARPRRSASSPSRRSTAGRTRHPRQRGHVPRRRRRAARRLGRARRRAGRPTRPRRRPGCRRLRHRRRPPRSRAPTSRSSTPPAGCTPPPTSCGSCRRSSASPRTAARRRCARCS